MTKLTWTHFVLTGALMAAGCGSDGKPAGGTQSQDDAIAQQSDELSVESGASVDEVNGLVDLAEGDLSFLALSEQAGADGVLYDGAGGAGGAGGAAGPRGNGDLGRPGLRPAEARFDFARAVRLAARAQNGLPCMPAPTIEKTMTSSACASIGDRGQFAKTVKVTFAGCTFASGGKLDGTITIDASKELAAGSACGPMAQIETSHAITIAGLSYTWPTGAKHAIDGSATAKGTRGGGATPTREWSVTESRKRTKADGTPVLDQKLTGSGKTEIAPYMNALSLLHNGMFMSEMHLVGITATSTTTNLRLVRDCCYPVEGTVEVTVTKEMMSRQHKVEWGPTCGARKVNGTADDLPMCL